MKDFQGPFENQIKQSIGWVDGCSYCTFYWMDAARGKYNTLHSSGEGFICLASLVVHMVKKLPAIARDHGLDPWSGKITWKREWQPTPVFLSGKSHGQRSLVGCSPWGGKESDTDWLMLSLSFCLSSLQSLRCFQLFETIRTAEHQGSLSITNSQSLLKLMSIDSVMPSNYLCHPLLFLPSIFPSIWVFSNESVLRTR